MLTLGAVLEALGAPAPELRQSITASLIDSRQMVPGGLFIALPGEQVDGHQFVADAFQRGAAVAIVDREVDGEWRTLDLRSGHPPIDPTAILPPVTLLVPDALAALQQVAGHWRRQLDVRVIGITGSVGKSTTKELAAEVLSRRFHTLKNPGNLNNEIGLPLTLLALDKEHQRAVLEMGFYVPGEIALLCDLSLPHVGVVTNISQVHMERAGSLEAIVDGKSELVENLPPAPDGVAILNYDDPLVVEMAAKTEARIFFYGLSSEADLWASEVEGLGLEGIRFLLHYQGETLHLRVPLLGRHSVHTALRAAAVGLAEGLSWQEIIAGLQSPQAQLRLVAVNGPEGALILDDTYNAAPSSTLAALNLLEELEGRRVAVLGDMLELGDFEERGHRMVGARAAQVADLLVVIGQRARWIAEEARRSGLSDDRIRELADSDQAIELLRKEVGAGDVVLVKASHGVRLDRVVAELEVPA
ncbi:MAG TPA: UDP-N-acetylmuramoyl-tripeptide--D-alanyl-D-alanine ligase [Anaerolineales bacterium]|jgi:UDP-N-acetylmuramoyl-tripeptide--D-alanyl-D-alanine ligase